MAKTLTKTELVAKYAEALGSTKAQASEAIEKLVGVISAELQDGNTVAIQGLGKFAVKDTPERQVRNPATGETMTKAAGRTVKATIAKGLKDSILA